MTKKEILCSIGEEEYSVQELIEQVKKGYSETLVIKTEVGMDDFFAKIGEHAYHQTPSNMKHLESDEFFSMIGRMTFDNYVPTEYVLIHSTSTTPVVAIIREEE